ncbi:MAG: enoyl-CoA hydratase-related protein [Candidatus Thalassarchaeaceae archaeon]
MVYSGCDNLKMTDSKPETNFSKIDIEGSVATITLNREQVYNALNDDLINELIQLLIWTKKRSVGENNDLQDSNGDKFLRILVLKSNGKHFCAGADINMMREAGSKTVEQNRQDSIRLDKLFYSLWEHPCFTIGTIQGVALGGGAGLISCLDHIIMTSDSQIALSEAKLGILPAVIGPYVYRKVGSAQFRRLSMMASRISAKEALRIGFANEVVDTNESFKSSVEKIINEVMSTGPMAISEAKKLTLIFDRWNDDDFELRQFTLDKTSEMRGSREGQEGLSSFLERRRPNWSSEE